MAFSKRIYEKPKYNWFNSCEFEHEKVNRKHTTIEVNLSNLNLEENKTLIEVVSTVEVGYKNRRNIETQQAEALIKFVGKHTERIYKHSLGVYFVESDREKIHATFL